MQTGIVIASLLGLGVLLFGLCVALDERDRVKAEQTERERRRRAAPVKLPSRPELTERERLILIQKTPRGAVH